MSETVKVGIIGGTGLDNPDILENRNEISIKTPFGKPSDNYIEGTIKGVPCVLLARHGRKHDIMPTNVNYRANIWGFKELKCTHILVTNACGSLKEEIKPGDIVFLDQFIDRTTKRQNTFYDGEPTSPKGVCHIPMATPFSEPLRELLQETAKKLAIPYHSTGTMVVIEGPRYSSKAESHMFRSWGAHTIGMTTCPEVVLANEVGLCYASIAMATDYDCWRSEGESVSVNVVMETFQKNVHKATKILLDVIPKIAAKDWTAHIKKLKDQAVANLML